MGQKPGFLTPGTVNSTQFLQVKMSPVFLGDVFYGKDLAVSSDSFSDETWVKAVSGSQKVIELWCTFVFEDVEHH